MRKMVDSGIDFIGAIPEHWKILRIKNLGEFRNGLTYSPQDICDEDDGILVLRSSNIKNGKLSLDDNVYVKTSIPNYLMIKEGDILICSRNGSRELIGKNAVLPQMNATFGAFMMIYRCKNPRYMYYVLNSPVFNYYLASFFTSTINQLTGSNFGNMKIPYCPDIDEQRAITSFLDAKCSEIDALIEDIQSEIEVLEAYKRSVISETVTKGLNKNVEMKDSGTEWLGNIPAHWKITRIGSVYNLRMTKVSDKDYEPLSVTMKGIVPQLDSAAKTNAHDDRKLVKKGDFVINSRSDRRGSCGISPMDGSVSLINTVLLPLDEMNSEYYDWLFHTLQFADEFYKWGHGIVDDLWTTGWQDMKRILIPSPPLSEQAAIANYLNGICSEIDEILSAKKEQLEVLYDYKKTIIFEYITGKKEV